MQVLKEEIRDAIIQAATEEFYLRGFGKASMRNIARKAGISVGNLYRYFDNKDALFEHIVKPIYDLVMHHILHHHDEKIEVNELTEENIIQLFKERGSHLNDLFRVKRKALITLAEGSKGSKYESFLDELFNVMEYTAKKDHLEKYYTPRNEPELIEIARPIMLGFTAGYWEIVKKYDDPVLLEKMITEYFSIWFFGFQKFMYL